MARRTLSITFIILLITSLLPGILLAQGRGRGNRVGPPAAPQARPPFAAAPPAFVGRPAAPLVPPRFGGQVRIVRPQPRVIISQPYGGFYSPYTSPYIYSPPVYAAPAYVGPGYVSPYAAPSVSQSEIDLAVQVERLSREIEQLRLEQAEAAARMAAPPPFLPQTQEPGPPAIPTTLLFRDGRRMNILNYAIVGQTLWVLDEQNSTKIPLSELDLEATQKENRSQGVRFPLPAR